MLLRGATAAARQGRAGAASELLAEAVVTAERTGVDRTDYEVVFGPSNVVMQSADVAVVIDDQAAAAEVARRMPRNSMLPLAARSRHLADVAHAELRLGRDQAAESALLTMEQSAPDWTAHHRLPRVLVGELLTRGVRHRDCENSPDVSTSHPALRPSPTTTSSRIARTPCPSVRQVIAVTVKR